MNEEKYKTKWTAVIQDKPVFQWCAIVMMKMNLPVPLNFCQSFTQFGAEISHLYCAGPKSHTQ
jgi:hypothetical protein